MKNKIKYLVESWNGVDYISATYTNLRKAKSYVSFLKGEGDTEITIYKVEVVECY